MIAGLYRLFRAQPRLAQLIWLALAADGMLALATMRWSLAFVALASLALSMAPLFLAKRIGIRLPLAFEAAIVAFVFATIFLGEAYDFYNRYPWWDVALHGGSALGFGLIGFLLIFMLFEGDRYAAPAWALSALAFAIAVTIGALWEIFEFAMDSAFGLNMQKSGLPDTMGDLIVDVIGAAIGAFCGFLFLRGREFGGLTGVLGQFVLLNRRMYRRLRERGERGGRRR